MSNKDLDSWLNPYASLSSTTSSISQYPTYYKQHQKFKYMTMNFQDVEKFGAPMEHRDIWH